MVAGSDRQRADLMEAITRREPLQPQLDVAPGQRGYWRQLINDLKTSQTHDRYQAFVELVTNAIDAVHGAYPNDIHVQIGPTGAEIVDHGKGMGLRDILVYLLIPTVSGKEGEETIGRFGMGFYAVLQLLRRPDDRIVVTTSNGLEKHRLTFAIADGSFRVSIDPQPAQPGDTGTTIALHAAIDEDGAFRILRDRLRFEPAVRLMVNGELLNDLSGFTRVAGHGATLYFSEAPSSPLGEAQTVLTINGVVIPEERVMVEGRNDPGTLVVSFPVTTSMAVSRTTVEVDAQTIRAAKAAIDAAARHDDRVRLLNALAPLIVRLQTKNPSSHVEDNLLSYLVHQFQAWAMDPGHRYLPDFVELETVAAPETVLVHPLIYERLPPQPWPFERYLEFQPTDPGVAVFVADFQDPQRVMVRIGPAVLLNRSYMPRTPRAKGALQQYLASEGIPGEFLFQSSWQDRVAGLGRALTHTRWAFGLPVFTEGPVRQAPGAPRPEALRGLGPRWIRRAITVFTTVTQDLWGIRPRGPHDVLRSLVSLASYVEARLIMTPLAVVFNAWVTGHWRLQGWLGRRIQDLTIGSPVVDEAAARRGPLLNFASSTIGTVGTVLLGLALAETLVTTWFGAAVAWFFMPCLAGLMVGGVVAWGCRRWISRLYREPTERDEAHWIGRLADWTADGGRLRAIVGFSAVGAIEFVRNIVIAGIWGVRILLGIPYVVSVLPVVVLNHGHYWYQFGMHWALNRADPDRATVDTVLEPVFENNPATNRWTREFLKSFLRRMMWTERGRAILLDIPRRPRLHTLFRAVAAANPVHSVPDMMLTGGMVAPWDVALRDLPADLLDRCLALDPQRFATFLRVTAHCAKVWPQLFGQSGEPFVRYYEMWRGLLTQEASRFSAITNGFLALPKGEPGPAAPYVQYLKAALVADAAADAADTMPPLTMPPPTTQFHLKTLVASYVQGAGPAVEPAPLTVNHLKALPAQPPSALSEKVAERLIANSANFQSTEMFIYLRELLQNAIDEINLTHAVPADRAIELHTMVSDHRLTIRFSDRMGMDLTRVIQSLLIPNVSTKRDVAGAIGRFGHGFFTVFRHADEVLLKTSRGGGAVVYVRLVPIRVEGRVVDVQVSLAVQPEYFKGTTVQVGQATDTPVLLESFAKNQCRTYGRTVSDRVAQVRWNGTRLNEVGAPLAQVPVNGQFGDGTLTVYHLKPEENLVTQNGLLVKPLDDDFAAWLPRASKDLLLKAGIVVDLPGGAVLLRDRSDVADADRQLAQLSNPLTRVSLHAVTQLLIRGIADLRLFPYDLYYEVSQRVDQVPDFIAQDVRRLLREESIDWAPYESRTAFAMLLASIPCIPVKGQEGHRSLLWTLRALHDGRITSRQVPRELRRYIAPQVVIENARQFSAILGTVSGPFRDAVVYSAALGAVAYAAWHLGWPVIIAAGGLWLTYLLARRPLKAWLSTMWKGLQQPSSLWRWLEIRWRGVIGDQVLPDQPVQGFGALWAFAKVSRAVAALTYDALFGTPRDPGRHTFYHERDRSAAHAYQGKPGIGWNVAYLGKRLVEFSRLLQGRLGEEALYRWAKWFHGIHAHETGHTLEQVGWTHAVELAERQKVVLQAQVKQHIEIDQAMTAAAGSNDTGIGSKRRIVQLLKAQEPQTGLEEGEITRFVAAWRTPAGAAPVVIAVGPSIVRQLSAREAAKLRALIRLTNRDRSNRVVEVAENQRERHDVLIRLSFLNDAHPLAIRGYAVGSDEGLSAFSGEALVLHMAVEPVEAQAADFFALLQRVDAELRGVSAAPVGLEELQQLDAILETLA
ncbi:MAG: ATP-binding protein [Candidatus Omnitrophica bacterium]|nr:ATP-binding protein [Candidatus Omnitrophota bacterium]